MSRRRARILTIAIGLYPCCALAAQPPVADVQEPQPTSTLLVRLKARNLPLDEAQVLAGDLQGRSTRARLQASSVLRASYLRHAKDYERTAERTLQRCRKLAARQQKKAIAERGADHIAELRSSSRKVTRGKGLTKARIKREIDPRLEELRSLLLPSVETVLAADAELASAVASLRRQHADLRAWFALYRGMTEGLELHPDAEKHLQRHPPPPPPGSEQAVDRQIELAAFDGLPMSPQDRKALAANEALRGTIDLQELLGTLELNRIRYAFGLGLVRIDTKLSDCARDHSKDMHELGFFSHTSPVKGKRRFSKRAANFGTSASSENIATGRSTGRGVIKGWYYSPGHHRNMLGGHRRTGLGRHRQMWTQMFGG